MKKEEMIALLRSVNCDENTVTAMTNAYEMGFEQGAIAYKLLTKVIESAQDVCQAVNDDSIKIAQIHAKTFEENLARVKDME